jgi:hypothetical protein
MFVRKPTVSQGETQAPAEAAGANAAPPAPAQVAMPDNAAPPPPPQKTRADKELENKRKKAEKEETKNKADKAAESKQAEQKLKEDNCKNAQGNVATYKLGRVRKVDAKGEYYYLDDAALKQALEQAEKEVADNCK